MGIEGKNPQPEKYCKFVEKCNWVNNEVFRRISNDSLSNRNILFCLENCYKRNFDKCDLRKEYINKEKNEQMKKGFKLSSNIADRVEESVTGNYEAHFINLEKEELNSLEGDDITRL